MIFSFCLCASANFVLRPPRILFPFFDKHPRIQCGIRRENEMALKKNWSWRQEEYVNSRMFQDIYTKHTFKKPPKTNSVTTAWFFCFVLPEIFFRPRHWGACCLRSKRSRTSRTKRLLCRQRRVLAGYLWYLTNPLQSYVETGRNAQKVVKMFPRVITRNSSLIALLSGQVVLPWYSPVENLTQKT